MVRDQILAVSGLLKQSLYGKSVKPPQPPNLWKTVSMVSSSTYSFTADTGPKIYRRSLYSFWKRAMPPPQMTIFDAPTRESCIARRERTNTPLQALVLMNEEQYFKAARCFARELLENADLSDEQRSQHWPTRRSPRSCPMRPKWPGSVVRWTLSERSIEQMTRRLKRSQRTWATSLTRIA